MTPRSTTLFAVGAAAIAVAALGATWAVTRGGGPTAGCDGVTVAGEAAVGGPFELVSETGATVTAEDVIDRPTLIYFGYTFCPDVCPIDAARNAAVAAALDAQGVDVRPVFISVDPDRDTPDVLDAFTDNLSPAMLGLTGSKAQIDAAVSAYRAYYAIGDTSDEYYLVDHTAFTYLMMPETGFATLFRREATVPDMVETIACYVDA